jgi:hypothetical protein
MSCVSLPNESMAQTYIFFVFLEGRGVYARPPPRIIDVWVPTTAKPVILMDYQNVIRGHFGARTDQVRKSRASRHAQPPAAPLVLARMIRNVHHWPLCPRRQSPPRLTLSAETHKNCMSNGSVGAAHLGVYRSFQLRHDDSVRRSVPQQPVLGQHGAPRPLQFPG